MELHWVDLSADFRLGDAARFAAVYGVEHGAPQLFERFTCALPELASEIPTDFASHPGCFATAMTLVSYAEGTGAFPTTGPGA